MIFSEESSLIKDLSMLQHLWPILHIWSISHLKSDYSWFTNILTKFICCYTSIFTIVLWCHSLDFEFQQKPGSPLFSAPGTHLLRDKHYPVVGGVGHNLAILFPIYSVKFIKYCTLQKNRSPQILANNSWVYGYHRWPTT